MKKYVQLSNEDNDSEIVDHANQCWELWQAAKAQAVSEGFVLVPKAPTAEMLKVGHETLIGAYEMGLSNDECIKHIYQAMIEAQEPAND